MSEKNFWKRAQRRAAIELDRLRKGNRYYNWYVFTQQLSDNLKKTLQPHYTKGGNGERTPVPAVVAVHNGWTESGGWADRLRGMVSTYLLCKELHRTFKILFTHPFPIELFLQPNTYDWRMDEADATFSIPSSCPICLEVGSESRWQAKKQREWMKRHLETSRDKQTHVYTNATFAYYEDFQQGFHELFKPSERLQNAIDRELAILGNTYVSASARFVGALGDFEDTVDVGILPEDKRELLINACMEQLERIHQTHPQATLLVNSDSTTFLQRAQRLPYTYILPGTIIHLDTKSPKSTVDGLYGTYEKTFLDFYMIAHATSIYRIQGRWMRASGFPYAASRVYGHPFHTLENHLKQH